MEAAERVAEHYDDFDVIYRALLGEHLHHGLWSVGVGSAAEAGQAMIHSISDRLCLAPGERLLDVGCAYGRMAVELAQTVGAKAFGITISQRQWEQAVPGIEIAHGDWRHHSYQPASFDAVIAIESLEHMADPERALRDIARVLRPGGRVVLGCWLRAGDLSVLEEHCLIRPIRQHAELGGMEDERTLRRWISDAGLEINQAEELSSQVARTWKECLGDGFRAGLRERGVRRALRSHPLRALRLAMSVLRIMAAYRTGALRYLVFKAHRVD